MKIIKPMRVEHSQPSHPTINQQQKLQFQEPQPMKPHNKQAAKMTNLGTISNETRAKHLLKTPEGQPSTYIWNYDSQFGV